MSNQHYKRAIIFSGGTLGEWALDQLSPDDYLIGADRGAEFIIENGYVPQLALGDFDSVTPDQMQRISNVAEELLSCDPIHKDWTDTELALREAVKRGFKDIILVGALGTRFDHSLGNVHLLRHALEHKANLTIIDANNEISLCTEYHRLEANPRYPYTSLLPLSPEVTGITLEGFRYPLHNATLKLGWSLGISNVLEEPTGTITISTGLLLVIRSSD
ncbi:thiamine diphosphokinase [Cohnella abietis]|uniref:Thiamine diphosphokinase n=1 Tax=Cohnella abietis TaxID=2507935 RepID=A0A3T1D6G7_9BACL|nr:thiamine diphosphokinase [Cohnella abietis]BBI33678.1 thiamine pyrophosphokinase [Cohnella abietis]